MEPYSYPYSWIDSDSSLKTCCDSFANTDLLAVDTEFMRSTTFFPKAALIQISDGEKHVLIDPLPINNFQPLIDLFTKEDCIKVFHSCSEDLEVLQYFLNCVPQPLIDTQIAAALLNIGSAVGYANAVKELLGKELDKGETRSDWLQRPLQDKQLTYAVQDVVYLLPLYQLLKEKLLACKRWTWLEEDCQRLIDNALQPTIIDDYYLKIKSGWKLNRTQLAVLKSLCTWREHKARELDVPRNHVVPEKVLFGMAQQVNNKPFELENAEGLTRKQRQNYGRTLAELIEDAKQCPVNDCPPLQPKPLSTENKKILKELKSLVEAIAEREGIPQDVLVKKQELEQVVRCIRNDALPAPARLLGWRKAIVGDILFNYARQM